MRLSPAAQEILSTLALAYAEAGRPARDQWSFQLPSEQGAASAELVRQKLLKVRDARPETFVLTAAGEKEVDKPPPRAGRGDTNIYITFTNSVVGAFATGSSTASVGSQTAVPVTGAPGGTRSPPLAKPPASPARGAPPTKPAKAAARPSVAPKAEEQLVELDRLIFCSCRTRDFSAFAGFDRKWHTVPTRATSATALFLSKISASEIEQHEAERRETLRKALGLRRSGLRVASSAHGKSVVAGDGFTFALSITQSELNPGEARVRRELRLSDPELLSRAAFISAFPRDVNGAEAPISGSMPELGDLADVLEELGYEVEEQPDGTAISFPCGGSDGVTTFDVNYGTVSVMFPAPRTLAEIKEGFLSAVAEVFSNAEVVSLFR